MTRLLRPAALLAILAGPALALAQEQGQGPAGKAAGTDVEAVRKDPDNRQRLNTFLSERFRAIGAAVASDAKAAEAKIAELKAQLETLRPTADDARKLMVQAKTTIARYERQIELARTSLATLEARLEANADDTDALSKYAQKVISEIGGTVRSDTAAAEKRLAEVKAYLEGLKARVKADSQKTRIDLTLKGIASFERLIGSEKARAALVGKKAAPLSVEAWVNGSPLADSDLKGKVVLLDFWAVWCGPCVATFPHLREWNAKYAEKGLVMVGLTRYYNYQWDEKAGRATRAAEGKVAPEKEQAMLAEFARSNQLTHRFGIQTSNALSDYYGVTGIPEVVVIDREGIVRLVRVGSGEANAKAIGELLETLLGAGGAASSGGQ